MSTIIFQPAKLRQGAGNGSPSDGLCLMQMVDWFSGSDKATDSHKCACPFLTRLAVILNDRAPSQEDRDSLWPLTWMLLDSVDPGRETTRLEYVTREVTRRLVAPLFNGDIRSALEADDIQEIEKAAIAGEVRGEQIPLLIATMEEHKASRAALIAAEKARSSGWLAHAIAECLHASSRMADSAAGRKVVWENLRAILIEAIHLGAHGEEDPVFIPRAERLAELVKV